MRAFFAALLVAGGLAGCASLSDHPEFTGLRPIPASPDGGPVRIRSELERVEALGNRYLGVAQALDAESRYAGAGVLGFGVYGAGVTAFNPAPKNLLAALLGGGTFQAWRGSLRPGERAKVYVQGYRAMDCLSTAGGSLLEGAEPAAALAAQLRGRLDLYLQVAAQARADAAADPTPPGDQAELLARLAAVTKTLTDLDAGLRVEQDAVADAPFRMSRVRREIEVIVDRRIDGLAPDFAAALKLIGESAKPPSSGQGGAAPGPAAAGPGPFRIAPRDLEDAVVKLEIAAAAAQRQAPTVATRAYENMGRCVEVAG